MNQVNEKSTAYLQVSFLNKAGVAEAPTTVTYSIYCLTNKSSIRASTSLTPGTSVEVTLGVADNTLISQSNKAERRVVTIVGTYGADDAIVDEFRYDVINLSQAI